MSFRFGCHCEEQSDMAIRNILSKADNKNVFTIISEYSIIIKVKERRL